MPKKLIFLTLTTLSTLAFITACATGGGYNPTVFPFEIESDQLAASPIKTVVIPHVNLGIPSRNHLEDVAPRVDARISSYLKANGYKVLPQRQFKQHWNTAVRAFGDPVDPTTGRVNMKTFSQIMQSVRDRFTETTELDAFVFTDLVELEVPFNIGLKHLGRWDGVSRRPSMQGPGTGVSAEFDWSMPAAVASLQVTIFDTELKRVFVSRGGLDATDAIDARSSTGRYIRRRAILENNSFVDEGIALALHPFIEMDKYPGNP
ncbi:hypothetical protein [Congregibacter litoralis]|uniref:Lipoprotein n=1 Tax=Congregibacter litoralis KT71 TaxID=314285 RepID=A4A7R6_9GAMM|nr:hypothetical protein [Congregibacter litoralis]EAQ97711.1 hypothetical protein KT71_14114 [Congregibacter litoralis KT71]